MFSPNTTHKTVVLLHRLLPYFKSLDKYLYFDTFANKEPNEQVHQPVVWPAWDCSKLRVRVMSRLAISQPVRLGVNLLSGPFATRMCVWRVWTKPLSTRLLVARLKQKDIRRSLFVTCLKRMIFYYRVCGAVKRGAS
jgi:hypothetical protein